ncbi:MAG: hypothetical protein ACI4PF_05455, partial [Christensenellales bacterium]
MALKMKNGKQVKNYFSSADSKQKKLLLFKLKFHQLLLWPKDKQRLLSIINTFLSLAKDKQNNEQGLNTEIQKIDSSNIVDAFILASKEVEEDKEKLENASIETSTEQVKDYSNNKQFDRKYLDIPITLYSVENCSAKVLRIVVKILNQRSKLIRSINLLISNDEQEDKINNAIEKVNIYNKVLTKFLPILNKQDTIDKFNLKTATKLFEDVCVDGIGEIQAQTNIIEIKSTKDEQDINIIGALSYVGIDVAKDEYGHYLVKNYNNGRGIK